MALADKREELLKKTDELKKFIEEHPIDGMTADEVKVFNERHDELGPLHDEVEALQKAHAADEKNRSLIEGKRDGIVHPDGNPGERPVKARSFDEIVGASEELKSWRAGGASGRLLASFEMSDAEWKNTIALTDINNPATRTPGIVPSAQNEVTVADLMLPGNTDNNSITYMEETTFTNNAAEVAEGAAKPESALDFTLRTDTVEVIATWLKATKQLLDDVKGFESYVRGRLGFMVQRREESELLIGDGTSPNISGILDRSGIQTQAKGADDTLTAIYKAMTLIRANAFSEPTAGVFHPLDWQDIATLKTADGIFIWGNPWDGGPERVWGLPVRVTAALTQNTGLVGAFKPHSQIFRRQGITVEIATEHASDFVSNLVTIRAEERLALAVYRPAAFATITGI